MDPNLQEAITAAMDKASNLKLPQFWRNDTALWFAQVDRLFESKNITDSKTKFNKVVSNLDPETAQIVRDIIMDEPEFLPYELLKLTLTDRTSLSSHQRVQKFLQPESLGDRKPSEMLRQMRQLIGDNTTEAIIKSVFLSRLPENVRTILAAMPNRTTEEIANIADNIYDISPMDKNQNNYNHQLLSEITALREEVKELKQTQRSKFHTTQAETNEQKSEGICWYHQTFKNKATKCNPPCNYKNPLNE